MIKLGKRLETLASFVDKDAIIADVGADHGKLIIYLAEKGIIAKGYGIENKLGPFQILAYNLRSAHSACLSAVLQDGISQLANDVDTIILAGLGGETIISILKEGRANLKNVQTIITDSHTSLGDVRKYIVTLGYIIKDEKLILERNKYYEITKFVKTDKPVIYTDFEYQRGPIIIQSPEFKQFAKKAIAKLDTLLKKDLPDPIKKAMIAEKEVFKTYED